MGSWERWIRNIHPLAAHYTVHALDHPSHGASAAVPRVTHLCLVSPAFRPADLLIGEIRGAVGALDLRRISRAGDWSAYENAPRSIADAGVLLDLTWVVSCWLTWGVARCEMRAAMPNPSPDYS